MLIDLGMTDEKQIMDALKMQLKIESIDLSTIRIPEEIIRLVEESVLRKYMLIPFQFNEALCQVLGCDSLNHAPLLDLELFLYLIYFTMILGMANKPSSAHLKIN